MSHLDADRKQLVMRPVVALADNLPDEYVMPSHDHPRDQLLYASSGVMSVVTDQGSFVVPPQRAVWLPCGLQHEVRCRGPVALRTVYIDRQASANLPRNCHVIEVSTLLRALILQAVQLPEEYDFDSRAGRIMSVLVDELGLRQSMLLSTPMPTDERLVRVCHDIFKDPSQERSLKELAGIASMSTRVFTRKFRSETGMGVARWRQHVRLLKALSGLSQGQSVTQVAFDVGYQTPSAFTGTFRRVYGTTPSDYFKNKNRHT